MKRKSVQILALMGAGAMVLSACATEDAEQPEPTAEEEITSTTTPSAPAVDLDQYAEALVTDPELMGVPQDPPIEGFVDEPVSMYLTLSDFNPTGQCEQLLEDLNSYSGPAVAGISAQFVKGGAAETDAQDADAENDSAAVETLIFETEYSDEPMSIYREIPNACETLTSDEVEGAEAVFTKVPGLDALHLEIYDGEETESLAVGGSSVNGTYHAYTSAEQVSMEEAEEMFGAQAEQLQETFEDEPTASPSPEDDEDATEPTDEPTDDE